MRPDDIPPHMQTCPACQREEALLIYSTEYPLLVVPPRRNYASHTYQCLYCGKKVTIKTQREGTPERNFETIAALSMTDMANAAYAWAVDKGFWDGWIDAADTVAQARYLLWKVALVHSELGEASEALRKGEKEHFKEELADTIIRILDICGALGIQIGERVVEKMNYNKTRPHKHGKVT